MRINCGVVDMFETVPRDFRVSQTTYGEEIQIIRTEGEWNLIETPDGYRGWVRGTPWTDVAGYETTIKTAALRVHIYSGPDTSERLMATLGLGSRLQVLSNTDPRWIKVQLVSGEIGFCQRGDVIDVGGEKDCQDVVALAKRCVGNVTYLWGGTSTLEGMDCSGFTQWLYKQVGIILPRDSYPQWERLTEEVARESLQPGDLVFFSPRDHEDRVAHVAMYIGYNQIIHSTVREYTTPPGVKITPLDPKLWHEGYAYKGARRVPKPDLTAAGEIAEKHF